MNKTVLNKNWEYYHQAVGFAREWIGNIKSHRKNPYQRTLRNWGKMWCDDSLSQIATGAQRIMQWVKVNRPEQLNTEVK